MGGHDLNFCLNIRDHFRFERAEVTTESQQSFQLIVGPCFQFFHVESTPSMKTHDAYFLANERKD